MLTTHQVNKNSSCPRSIHKSCRKYRFKKSHQPAESNPTKGRGKGCSGHASFEKRRQQLFQKHLAKKQELGNPTRDQMVALRPKQKIPDYLSLDNEIEDIPEDDFDLLGDFT